mmetsp:Transcript_45836/g.113925  ORF Transcript_45836/g.113925 Transcript_45836/m.113925 type:complete len:95 (-) Transcript_45836:823-1107(-)
MDGRVGETDSATGREAGRQGGRKGRQREGAERRANVSATLGGPIVLSLKEEKKKTERVMIDRVREEKTDIQSVSQSESRDGQNREWLATGWLSE